MYDKSGTENLRANPSVKGPASVNDSTSKGESVGGTANLRANATVMTGPKARGGMSGSNDIPAPTFRDKAV